MDEVEVVAPSPLPIIRYGRACWSPRILQTKIALGNPESLALEETYKSYQK